MLVLILCGAAAWILWLCHAMPASVEPMRASHDLYVALVYFLEANEGRFPDKEALEESPFIQVNTDGSWSVRPPGQTSYELVTYGIAIHDLERFQIHWGANLPVLTLSAEGVLLNEEGVPTVLIVSPNSPGATRWMSEQLYLVAKEHWLGDNR